MNHPLNIFLLKESQQSDHEAEQKHVWSALFNIGSDTAVAASQITHTYAHPEVGNTTPENFLLFIPVSSCFAG